MENIQHDYKKEYEGFITAFTELKNDLTTDSGDIASKRIMEIEGMNFRIGMIISELDSETVDNYLMIKEDITKARTDKQCEFMADYAIRSKYGISNTHFKHLNKAFISVIQSFKKRLKQLDWERYQ